MELAGILIGLALLVWLAYRGWSVLLLAPAAAMLAAALSGEPMLAHWTQTFMQNAARFVAQFFPLFLLGALFGKLMEDSGAVRSIAAFLTDKLGARRAMFAVVLGGTLVTYGGVSLFVAFFVLAPMAHALFREANIPVRLMPAAIALGTSTFTMSAMPGTPAIQNAIPMPFFGTTPFAAPGLGLMASAIMLGTGLWWLSWREAQARHAGHGYAEQEVWDKAPDPTVVRERASVAREFDPAEIEQGHRNDVLPGIVTAALPLLVVIAGNFVMNVIVFPRLDASFLAQPEWGGITLQSVAGVWGVCVALASAILVLVALQWRRLPALRKTMDAGANASVLPIMCTASLVGYGGVIAALPGFEVVRDWVLSIDGGPLVSLALSANLLAAITGSASGGLTIALDALGPAYVSLAAQHGIDPALMHRVAVIASGTLDSLPHNGAVVTLLAVCGSTHRESYLDIVMTSIVSALIALVAVIVVGSLLGTF
ncbi:transporter [Pandoraea faecigallinarum]|uniref:Transporter n=1 Tax=Pandoraea faecigallinarum TaxID=656179 RepID=A0A0H3WWW9_9BURK|nr:GntP family permease [Pandoraea faecigallinarum]AKM31118.1 transporter [Pandoraea faecigallinarum]